MKEDGKPEAEDGRRVKVGRRGHERGGGPCNTWVGFSLHEKASRLGPRKQVLRVQEGGLRGLDRALCRLGRAERNT